MSRGPKRRGRKQRTLSRYTCSAAFRNAFERRLPGLKRRPAYWQLLEHLLFAKERGRDRPLLIPHEELAAMAGEEASTYRSGDFLVAFQRDVLPDFEWEEYSYAHNRVREVADDGLPGWAVEELRKELAVSPLDIEDRVYFATGYRYDKKRDPKRLWLADLAEAEQAAVEQALNADQAAIAEYLHGLSKRNFCFLSQHAAGASAVAAAIENAEARTQAQKLLARIHIQPVPAYRPVGNSYRMFSAVGGLQQLYKDVRVALMAGCCDLDADALHLAIMASKWEIPELQQFLDTHGAAAVWRALTAHVADDLHGRDPMSHPLSEAEHKAYKGALKHGVYALGYGGGKDAIARQVKDHDTTGLFGDYEGVVDCMLRWDVIAAVFEAKERMMAQIIEDKGTEGHYGWIPMQKGRGPLSVLAMGSSSYELALMKTVFDVATQYSDYGTILVYQFDGVTIRFRRKADTDWMIEKMQTAFDEKARELGITSSLSADWL
jgi:hypothetical protein